MRLLLPVFLLFSFALDALATEQEVSDLMLSEIMFYRMQDNNFEAIRHYLAAGDEKIINLNKNDTAYIASVYLNYDLHSQVNSMLELLLNNESEKVRDKSWFYLGKLHYKNKRVESAVAAFSKIERGLASQNQEMKYIMYGVMAMNNSDYKTAIKEFSKISAGSLYTPYVKYNLAVARMKKNNDIEALEKNLTELAYEQATKSGSHIFSDQVYTTLGYVLLQRKQFEKSKISFRKVSLHGHLASRALQGMIYASSELQQFEIALNLSLQLIKMTVGNEAIHHAYIVIPYLLQKLNNDNKAVAFYQRAVEYFGQQRIDLDQYIYKIQKGEFDQHLLDLDKILHVNEWVDDNEMSRLFRFVSTLDEWRDAVYKYNEMKYLENKLDEVFYQLVVTEPDIEPQQVAHYNSVVAKVESARGQVKQAIAWHQKFARRFVVTALQNQHSDVTDYLAQARFALAQFYDREEQRQKQLEIDELSRQQNESLGYKKVPARKKQQ